MFVVKIYFHREYVKLLCLVAYVWVSIFNFWGIIATEVLVFVNREQFHIKMVNSESQ